jgi:hypothetical protein
VQQGKEPHVTSAVDKQKRQKDKKVLNRDNIIIVLGEVMKLDKKILAMGAGAGVGAIVPTLLKKYVEPTYGASIPYMETLGIWGTWHVFVPLVSGAAMVVVTQFTNLIRNDTLSDALAMYGFAALFSGIMFGATDSLSLSRAKAPVMTMNNRPVAYVARNNTVPTITGISNRTIVS